jgi:hypothetical protein
MFKAIILVAVVAVAVVAIAMTVDYMRCVPPCV